jgi:hypothetical protein
MQRMLNSSHSDQSSDHTKILDEIMHNRTKWCIAGILCFLAIPIYLLSPYAEYGTYHSFFTSGYGPIWTPGLVLSGMVTAAGMFLLAIGLGWGMYHSHLKTLLKYFPPPITITKKYAVTKHGNTYVFALRNANYSLFLVALRQSTIGPSEKIRVPRTIRQVRPAHPFQDMRTHDAEGTFSIPTPEGNIISGEGLLVAVSEGIPLYQVNSIGGLPHPKFYTVTTEGLFEVAEYVQNYVSEGPGNSEKPDESKEQDEGFNSLNE